MSLNTLSLKAKLIGGFTAVFVLLFVISVTGFYALKGAATGFEQYREMATDTNLAGRLQANMLMARMDVKNFIISGSEKVLTDFNERWTMVMQFQAQAQKDIVEPKRAAKIDEIGADLGNYRKGFDQVVKYRADQDKLVNEVLNVQGPLMEKTLTDIMSSANIDNDVTAAFHAGMVMRNFLLARLYVVKFLDTNDPAAVDRVHKEFEEMTKRVATLDKEIDNSHRRELLATFQDVETLYLSAFDEVVAIIIDCNNIIDNTLDILGPEVASDVEFVKLDIKAVQDKIGPRLYSSNEKAVTTIIIITLLSNVIGVFIVVFITRSVLRQLGSDPADIEAITNQIANGNLAVQFDEDEKKNVGVYASMRHMTENLSGMFKEIKGGVLILDSSSNELSSVSEQMASNAEQTSERSSSVAAASEEMSTNMNSVAAATEQTTANIQTIVSAVEEMSATIGEISKNTAKGSETTNRAVLTAQHVSGKVDELGKAASEISKVTDTIADISAQTNLLALNATIEAARAGEAGKGFAVVAGEIKALAQQTAEATSDISSKITGVQDTTKESVSAIESIVSIINEVNEIVITVASAIEEQSATTQEISSNISQAASGVDEVNENVNQVSSVVAEVNIDITQVSQAAEEMRSGGMQVNSKATELSQLARDLNEMVSRFTI